MGSSLMFGSSPFSSAPISEVVALLILQALTAIVSSVATIVKLPIKLITVDSCN